MSNPLAEFDRTLSLWIHSQAHPWLDRLMPLITRGGNWEILLLVTLAGALFLRYRYQRRREALLFLLAFAFIRIVDPLLKLVFQRGRPQLWEVVGRPTSYSFPSGHALSSMMMYGLLAYLLAQLHPQWRWAYWAGAAIWILLIGFSRVYLGVHWTTDVLAGFAVGLILVYLFVRWYEKNAVPRDPHSLPR